MNELNPYGHGEIIRPVAPTENLHEYAMERARQKLAITRRGHPEDKTAGTGKGLIIGVTAVAVIVAVPLVLLSIKIGEIEVVGIFGVFLTVVMGLLYLVAKSNRPTSPKKVIQLFFNSLNSATNSNFKRAKSLTIAADMDSAGRIPP